MTNMGVTFGASLFRFPPQIGPVCEKSAPFYPWWYQNMMAATAGIIKGEFQAVSFGSAGPVVGFPINIQVVYQIAGTCGGLNREKLEKVAVGQMTINTLGRKPLGILAAVNCILP